MAYALHKDMWYFTKTIVRDLGFFGSYVFALVVLLVSFILNELAFAKLYLISVVSFTILEIIIKMLYVHKRPDFKIKHPESPFEKFEERTSFPSGHSGKAAIFATVLHLQYHIAALSALFAIIAVFVGIARVFYKRHFVTDVIAGYTFGIAVALLMYRVLV